MSHLSAERLAALIDEQPSPAELAHLAGCAPCRRERGAYEAVSEMTKTGLTLGTPLTSWNNLAPRLRHDGIIDNGRGFGRGSMVSRGWMQAAAAVLLMAGGTAVGRLSAGVPLLHSRGASAGMVALTPDAAPTFRTVAEAQAAAARSQNTYQASMAFIASRDTNSLAISSPAAIKTRLATLDRVSQIVGAALEDAPYDSVINTMYLNAQGQREASMRQLSSTSGRLTSY
jgi:hypothetical protein